MDKHKDRESERSRRTVHQGGSIAPLLPIMAMVFVAYLVSGLAMPVLPLHVHHDLGLGTFVVGLVASGQFAASLISRLWAGHHSDSKGAKRAVVAGLGGAVAAGLLYLLSLRFVGEPETSVAILILGRGILGGAESFIVTGAVSWGSRSWGRSTRARSWPWSGRRSTPPSRSARRSAPRSTPVMASRRSRSQRR
jgi:MFS family permease